jgi:hypothetical protein
VSDAHAELARKYRLMLELRHAGAPDERAEDRARLRALAGEFPGALRELDTLPTDEIERRAQALESGAREPWMEWLAGYHAVTRVALEVKRTLPNREAAIAAARRSGLDDAFVDAIAAPPHGRIMVVVFDRLAERFGVPAKQIWDTLFPTRKGERGYRRR